MRENMPRAGVVHLIRLISSGDNRGTSLHMGAAKAPVCNCGLTMSHLAVMIDAIPALLLGLRPLWLVRVVICSSSFLYTHMKLN